MKRTLRITAALLLLALLTGCSQPEEEPVEIPSLDETTASENKSNGPLNFHFYPDGLNPTSYEALWYTVINYAHLILEDIEFFENQEPLSDLYASMRELLIPLSKESEKTTTYQSWSERQTNSNESSTRGLYTFYAIDAYLNKIAEEYPEKISERPEIIEIARIVMKNYQNNYDSKSSVLYNALYNLVFPNVCEPVLTKGANGENIVTMPGYEGGLVIYYGKIDYPSYDEESDRYVISSQPVTLRPNYSGEITVMPAGEYNIAGRPYYLTVEGLPNDGLIAVLGDKVGHSSGEIKLNELNEMPDISHALTLLRENPSPLQVEIMKCSLTSTKQLFDVINEDRLALLNLSYNKISDTLDLSACLSIKTIYLSDNSELTNLILPEDNGNAFIINLMRTSVESLEFARGLRLIDTLNITQTNVTDLSPLSETHIQKLNITPETIELETIAELDVKTLAVAGYHADWNDKILPLAKANGTTSMVMYYDQNVPIQVVK